MDGSSALHIAAKSNSTDIIKYIIQDYIDNQDPSILRDVNNIIDMIEPVRHVNLEYP